MKIKLISSKYFYLFLSSLLLLTGWGIFSLFDISPISQYAKKGKQGVVVAAHPLASKVGGDILQQGGNAVDASIAIQLVLAVVYPRAGNIGGGGFCIYRNENGQSYALDFREVAPLNSHKDMYQNQSSLKGGLAVGIPGTIKGLVALHHKFGQLPFEKLVFPAIYLAQNGVVLTDRIAQGFNDYKDEFIEVNGRNIPFVKNELWKKGDTLFQPHLAKTLSRIAKTKGKDFYEGTTAKYIVKSVQQKGKGIISYQDLERYNVRWRKPFVTKFYDWQIITMPPPSSGGYTIAQILGQLQILWKGKAPNKEIDYIHTIVEASKRAFADRATHLADPDFVNIPDSILSKKHFKYLLRNYSGTQSTPSIKIKEGKSKLIESYETTHFSVVDKDGNAISFTSTLNSNFGSKVFVKEAGFFLNNEMDDFVTRPDTPNQFGLIESENNNIVPQKRMLSSMTPTIIEKGDQLSMVLGSPGGPTIISSVLQVFLNIAMKGKTPKEAVESPRFHHQWLPDMVHLEENFFEMNTDIDSLALKKRRHQLFVNERMGAVELIYIDGNTKIGIADRRRIDDCVFSY